MVWPQKDDPLVRTFRDFASGVHDSDHTAFFDAYDRLSELLERATACEDEGNFKLGLYYRRTFDKVTVKFERVSIFWRDERAARYGSSEPGI